MNDETDLLADVLRKFLTGERTRSGNGYINVGHTWDIETEDERPTLCIDSTVELTEDELAAVQALMGVEPEPRPQPPAYQFTVRDDAIDSFGVEVGKRITITWNDLSVSGVVKDITPAGDGFSTYSLDDVQPAVPEVTL